VEKRALRRRSRSPAGSAAHAVSSDMDDVTIGRFLRALRHRRGWRPADLAAASGVARSVLSELEAGRLDAHSLGALRRSVHAAGGVLRLTVDVPGGDRSRLLDADHARLQAAWAEMLVRFGWEVVPEATYSVYGERGSIDLLAWHPSTRMLLVVELKTIIVDAGELVRALDRKTRLARTIARERGWMPVAVAPALIVLEGTTVRRRVVDHAPLFGRLNLRGRAAARWLRSPSLPAPTGLLLLTKLPGARSGDRRRAGRRRIRLMRHHPRSPRSEADASSAQGGA
jgi:transcriptional regulator with XRE-family HTH domain